jgi:hypothetical protein
MPAAAKTEELLRKQKEAKQKKLLLGLVPVLLILLVWQGPKMFGAFFGGESATEATPTTATPTGTVPDPATGLPPSTANNPDAAQPAAGGALPDTDNRVDAGTGQLVTFDRFVGKDPFKQQVEGDQSGGGGGATSGGGGTTGGITSPGTVTVTPGGSGGSGGSGGGRPAGPTSASLSVNGNQEAVSVGAAFPKTDPVFRLASLASTSARIGLVDGSFSSGDDTIKLSVGKTLTLVSQPDGTRYTIRLIRIS